MMLGALLQGTENKNAALRLREMVTVLRRHDIVHGLTPEKLRAIFEDLGPTFVKFGQIMSMRPDFLPTEYCDELMKLQTAARPLAFPIILSIVEQEYNRDWNKVFRTIDSTPLGSASIAQAHRATLASGEEVVIKVQRPGIHEIMRTDLTLMKRAATLIRLVSSDDVVDFRTLMDEMWNIAKQEMDFLIEASHIEEFTHLNRDNPFVSCPRVLRDLSTQHILVMEYIDGIPLDQTDALHAAGVNVTQVGRRLGENYAKQIIEDGFFHGDPHPGNIRIRNGNIVWLDLGMIGRLSNRDRTALRRAIMALATHDTFEMKAAILALGIVKGRIDHAQLYQDIDVMMEQYGSLDFTDVHMGVLTNQILSILRMHHIGCPSGLAMFARGVMTVEIVMRRCAPEVSFLEIFARSLSLGIVQGMTWREGLSKARQEGIMLLRKSVQIPEQLADLLKMTMGGQTKLNIDLTGSEEPVQRLDKMINKLIISLLCAALLIASSTICTTNMQPQIGGIPLLGILGYLIAFILSLRLIWDIHKGV